MSARSRFVYAIRDELAGETGPLFLRLPRMLWLSVSLATYSLRWTILRRVITSFSVW